MLGVLKRRLKPKRARDEKDSQSGRKNVHNKSEAIVPVDVARLAPSQRQIHPVFDEKAQVLAYDDSKTNSKISTPTANSRRSPDDPLPYSPTALPKRSAAEPVFGSARLHSLTPTTPSPTFHPAPNICVEGGRIEFIKSPSEGSNLASINPPRGSFDNKIKSACLSQCAAVPETKKVAPVTRAQETQADFLDFEVVEEKCDFAKEFFEAKIKELQRLLECEQEAVQKERLAVTRLQRQLARRDATQRDVDRERRLRADTESRLRETVSESERYRESLAGLQREFSKMEDTLRTMLQYKTRCELLNQEKVFLTAIYESRVVQYQNTITKLEQENESLKQRLRLLENIETEDVSTELLERLRSLETENANLFQDADFQIKQYERCLDDIANQVVRALLSQKGLREEIGNLQRRIKELESQNYALADILVNRFDKSSAFALPSTEGKAAEEKAASDMFPGAFSGDIFSQESPSTSSSTNFNCKTGERKRLQRLHLSDLGDKNILKSLSSFESLLVVPLQRPRSLSLQLHTSPMPLSAASSVTGKRCQNKKGKLNLVTLSKKPSEDEGNESPESGNRDEGYSTMSSDVQGLGETNELSKRELEDLKEASDETEVIADANGEMTSTVVVEEISDPDMFFIPLNLSLTINSRQSYPPSKNFLPFHHAMRSFSDSHLCLKLTTTAVPSSLSPSVFFLKKSKLATNFPIRGKNEKDVVGSQSSAGSWCNGNWWDAEFFQQWLKLDDTRLKQQQQQDMLQLQYDRTEIEEWSMSLSCEDVAKSAEGESPYFCKISESSELLTNAAQNKSSPEVCSNRRSTYNCSGLTVDTRNEDEGNWICEGNESKKSAWQMMSPGSSWCSASTNNSEDCCRALNDCYFNDCSETKSRSSPAVSDDGEESSAIDTDFTRDFYRLVKFESTKSLTSNSSKSNGHCDLGLLCHKQSEFAQEREMALQSVLSFIVEQQRYCHDREEKDVESRSCSESPSAEVEAREDESDKTENDNKVYCFCDNDEREDEGDEVGVPPDRPEQAPAKANERGPDLSLTDLSRNICNDLGENILLNDKNSGVNTCESGFSNESVNKKTNGSQKKGNHCSGERETITKLPVRNFKSKNSVPRCVKSEKIQPPPNIPRTSEPIKSKFVADFGNQNKKQGNRTLSHGSKHLEKNGKRMSESPDAHSEKISPKTGCQGKVRETWIPVSTPRKQQQQQQQQQDNICLKQTLENKTPRPRTKGTKIPVVSYKKVELPSVKKTGHLDLDLSKPNSLKERYEDTNIPVPTGRGGKNFSRSTTKTSKTLESPPSKVVVVDDSSFHEKATTKDVINELNRMIRKGEEVTPNNGDGDLKPLDMACCCPTGWVHVERDIDFTDPKARANLLDVMLASSGSSSGSGSSSDSGGDEPVAYNHLHKLHRFRRQRKASATREQLGVLRYPMSSARPSIIGRENFFVRYGDKEKEAVASFDFLEEISTTSLSGCSSSDSLESNRSTCLKPTISPVDQELPSPEIDICTPITPTTPVTPSDDSDERTGGPVSLSDSCVESYPESLGSTEDQ